MMKKILLSFAILLTAANLAAGVAYAAVCETKGGARQCGDHCTNASEGRCVCEGACTSDEMKWVGGGGAAAAMEELAY
jgi:hypothetical protein